MSVLLHLSDTHFGTEQLPVVEALVQLAHEQRPEVAVLSGDITQRARRSQFAAAQAFVQRLKIPKVLAVPGNHDIPLFNVFARLFAPYAGYQSYFGAELQPGFTTDDLFIVCLNTTRPWRHKQGEISEAQMKRCQQALRQASASQLRVVVVHQPLVVPNADERSNLLRQHQAACQGLQRYADLVLGGHIHLPYVLANPIQPHPVQAEQRFWCVQAGTAVSKRTRQGVPNSVNLIRVRSVSKPRRFECTVEQWDYHAATKAFQLKLTHQLFNG